jgi:chromosome segregation ATPase
LAVDRDRSTWTDERLDERMTAIDQRFDRIDVSLEDIRAEIREVRGEIRGLRDEFSALKDRLVQIGFALAGLHAATTTALLAVAID